jgi:hypothetical protein
MSSPPDTPKATTPGVAASRDEDRTAAIKALERALGLPPAELTAEVDVAERAIARLRNRLIAKLRAAPAGDDTRPLRQALDAANVPLSLVAGVEYPAAGIQRTLLEQAVQVLRHTRRASLSARTQVS